MTKKFNILSFLRKNPGSWISGEELSSSFNISRAAINKHIQILRETGYTIESQTNKGYKYINSPDKMFPEEIQNNLKSELFGKKIFYFDSIDSTNSKGMEFAENGEDEGAVVVAEAQTKGRGRRSREWASPHFKGIYASVILRPKIIPAKAFQINYVSAVALADTIFEITSAPVKIKWPNDILLNKKKIAGILTEMNSDSEIIKYLVCGFGLNVNTEILNFDQSLREKASSLIIETGILFSRVELLQVYLYRFEKLYKEYISGRFHEILEKWKTLSDITGKGITIDTGLSIETGTVKEIDEDGLLILQKDSGEIKKIYSGDVELL